MRFHSRLTLFTIAALAALLVACGGGGGDEPAPPSGGEPDYDPVVQPYSGDAADVLLDTSAPDGRLPCGVFDLANPGQDTGWGDKTARLPDFPTCPQEGSQIELLCLDANAAWTEAQFNNISVSVTGLEINWFSQQDGICGLFPVE